MVSPRENVSIPLAPENPAPPRPLYALLSLSCSGVGLAPTLLLLGRLGGFWGLVGVQFSTQLVALAFGLFAPMLLFGHPLVQRGLRHFAAVTFGAELFAELSQLAGRTRAHL